MGETHGSRVGRRIILPASFIGGQEICAKSISRCNGISTTIWETRHFSFTDL